VCQSLSKIQAALQAQKELEVSRETIRALLNDQEIRPKSNVKRLHPQPHPDRDRQFQYLTGQRMAFAKAGWPSLSVDTKKKEWLGNFFNPVISGVGKPPPSIPTIFPATPPV
jgi:hypothetical protein